MLSKIREILVKHIKNNSRTYFFLLVSFVIGIAAGAFTVNGLSSIQKDELSNYFEGFMQLLGNQKVDNGELLTIALRDNFKLVLTIWVLGVMIIGIPFIFILVGIRGFITGFSSGFIIQTLGLKGVLFTALALYPTEIIIVPCIIALGVNGINFSMNIIKSKSIRRLSKENLKARFMAYCFVTIFFSCFIFCGSLIQAYITPVIIRLVTNFVTG